MQTAQMRLQSTGWQNGLPSTMDSSINHPYRLPPLLPARRRRRFWDRATDRPTAEAAWIRCGQHKNVTALRVPVRAV